MITDLYAQLRRDEGLRLVAYKDSLGNDTIGYGHKMTGTESNTCSQAQAEAWLKEDVAKAVSLIETHLPWSDAIDDARREVLQNMCFNMGWGDGQHHGLSTFHNFLAMVQAGNYDGAACAMLESKWAKEVGPRATRLSQQMRAGISV